MKSFLTSTLHFKVESAILGYLISGYFRFQQISIDNYGFSLDERLLTQSRILWNYVGWLFFLNPASMNLFNGDYVFSTGITTPLSTLISIFMWLVVTFIIFFHLNTEKIKSS